MFDMINIFEVFLPQLLRYPNPTDPLNGEAAALLMRDPKNYEVKVKGRWISDDCTKQPPYVDIQNTFRGTQRKTLPTMLVTTRILRAR